MSDWKTLCLASSKTDASCSLDEAFVSPLYGSAPMIPTSDYKLDTDPLVTNFVTKRNNNAEWAKWGPNFGKHDEITTSTPTVPIMRTFLRFGAPIDVAGTDFLHSSDRIEKQ